MREFVIRYRHLIANITEAEGLKSALYSGIYATKTNIVLTIFWICLIAAGYWASLSFISNLIGNDKLFSDWLFYVLSIVRPCRNTDQIRVAPTARGELHSPGRCLLGPRAMLKPRLGLSCQQMAQWRLFGGLSE
jgi:hypothetical protein